MATTTTTSAMDGDNNNKTIVKMMKPLLVLNTCRAASSWPGDEVYDGLELLFDAVEHQPYLRDVKRQHVYFVVGDYRHGDCGLLSALARYATFDGETTLLPVTLTHIAYVKSDAAYNPDATEAAWSQKLALEFEFSVFDHSPDQMCAVRRTQTLVFRRYSAAALASLASF